MSIISDITGINNDLLDAYSKLQTLKYDQNVELFVKGQISMIENHIKDLKRFLNYMREIQKKDLYSSRYGKSTKGFKNAKKI